MGPEGARAILEGITDLHVARGKRVLHFDLTDPSVDEEEVLGLILGRSGKLRSPSMRTGTTLLVGYTPELLETQLL